MAESRPAIPHRNKNLSKSNSKEAITRINCERKNYTLQCCVLKDCVISCYTIIPRLLKVHCWFTISNVYTNYFEYSSATTYTNSPKILYSLIGTCYTSPCYYL